MAEAMTINEARGDGYGVARTAVSNEIMNRVAARRRERTETAQASSPPVAARPTKAASAPGAVEGTGRPALSAEVRALLASSNTSGSEGRAANAQLVGRLVEAIRALEKAV